MTNEAAGTPSTSLETPGTSSKELSPRISSDGSDSPSARPSTPSGDEASYDSGTLQISPRGAVEQPKIWVSHSLKEAAPLITQTVEPDREWLEKVRAQNLKGYELLQAIAEGMAEKEPTNSPTNRIVGKTERTKLSAADMVKMLEARITAKHDNAALDARTAAAEILFNKFLGSQAKAKMERRGRRGSILDAFPELDQQPQQPIEKKTARCKAFCTISISSSD